MIALAPPHPLRIGIAGAPRGASFLAGLGVVTGARLTAVYDPAPAAAAALARAVEVETVCESFAHLLSVSDAVVLASPQHYHAPQAVAALAAGRHVLSEVPAAVSLEQAATLLAAARGSGAVYMLAENYGYKRPNLIVSELVRRGLLGDLYFAEGEYLHEMKSWHHDSQGQPTWRHHWQVGRDGHTYPTHSLGPVLSWLDDRLAAVSCVGTGRHTAPAHALQDTVLLLGRTTRGALVKVRFDLLSNRPHLMDYYSVQGTAGAYEAARAAGEQPRIYLHGRSPTALWEPLETYAAEFLPARYRTAALASAGHGGSDAWPIVDFLTAIAEQAAPPIDIYRALDMTLPGLLSEQSIAQGGAWVAVPDPRLMTAGIGPEPGRAAPLT